ncbi:MAG: MlaD family protein [Baekduia sp.]
MSARRTSRARLRLTGLLIVLITPVAVALATFRPSPGGGGREVHVIVDEAKGLAKVERDVRVGGVNVGTITEVRRVGEDAELTLKISDDAGEIFADARAELRPHSIFEGSAFVDLYPGTPSAGPLQGDTIPRRRTHVSVSVDQALRGLDADSRASLQSVTSELAASMTPEASAATRRTLRKAPALIEGAGVSAEALRGPGGTSLHAALRDIQAANAAVASRSDALGPVARDADRTLAALSGVDGAALDALLARLPGALTEVRGGATEAAALATELRRTAEDVGPALREATPAMAAYTPTLKKATPVLKAAPDLVDELRLTLADLDRAATPMQQLLGPIEKAIDDMRTRALPAMHAKTRLGTPAYRQFFTAATGLTGALSQYQTRKQSPTGYGRFVKISGNVADGLMGTLTGTPDLTP